MKIKIDIYGTLYELNDDNNTALVYHSEFFCNIPRSVKFNSKEYLVVGIKESCLHNSKLIEQHFVYFNEDVQISSIEKNTFINASNIEELNIPPSLKELKDGWCKSIEKLKNISISSNNYNFKIIDEKLLIGKSNIQNDVFDILKFGFRDIVHAIIPSYITCISPFSFSNCFSLKTFEISENSNLNTICNDAFNGSPIRYLYIPSQLTELKNGWCANTPNLNDIKISPKNENFKMIENKMIVGKSNPNNEIFDVLVFACRDIKEAIIPSYIKYISPFCFEKCERLENIKFDVDSNVTTIGNDAFGETYLKYLNLPSKLTELKTGWCANTPYLSYISISPKNENFRMIENKMIIGKSYSNNEIFDVLVFACRNIKEAIIPSYIKYISPYCFENCNLLQKVEFSEDSQLILIGEFAFSKSSIERINIPKKCEHIEEGAFFECILLEMVEFHPNSKLQIIEERTFSKTSLKSIQMPKHIKTIGKDAFSSCNLLINIDFNENSELSLIGEQSFMNTPLIEIKIPDHVKQIGRKAFYNCRCLTNVELSKNSELISIEDYSFYYTSISSIFIPSKTKYIQYKAFIRCEKLENITIGSKSELYYIGNCAFFYNTSIKKFKVPANVQFIEKDSFDGYNLELEYEENSKFRFLNANSSNGKENCLIIPNKIKEIKNADIYGNIDSEFYISLSPRNKNFKIIDEKMIAGKSDPNYDIFDVLIIACRDIKGVIQIPSYIKRISSHCFEDCNQLTSVEFSSNSNLISIDECAFYNSQMIESISIPNHVKSIGKDAFSGCTKLKTIIISEDSELEFIDENAFQFTSIKNIFIPKNFRANSLQLFSYDFEYITISSENENIKVVKDKLIVEKSEENKKELDTLVFAFRNITNAIVPKYIKHISQFCFYECNNLQTVEFEQDSELISIGEKAFYMSSIENISFPVHLKSIECEAFAYTKKLNKVIFPDNVEIEIIKGRAFRSSSISSIKYPDNLTTIEGDTFCECHNLNSIKFSPNSKLTCIKSLAFANSSIKEIIIPSHVKIIGYEAFYCCEKLETVLFDKNSELTKIEGFAFYSSNIRKIIIPKNVKFINGKAFDECRNLENVEFEPNSKLEIIDRYAFCSISASKIIIPRNVKKICEGSFGCNKNLAKLEFEDNSEISSFYLNAIFNTNITQINIPSKVKYINAEYFYVNKKIEKIVISPPNKYYKSINDDQMVLENSNDSYDTLYCACQQNKNIKIPPDVKSISSYCFYDKNNFRTIEFPENSELQTIGRCAFNDSNIEKITIPSHVQSIEYLFCNCQKLKYVDFAPNSELKKIGGLTFNNSKIEKLSIPTNVISLIDGWCANTPNLNDISISPKNENFKMIENKMIIGKSNSNNEIFDVLVFACRNIKEAIIPSYIKYISPYCFDNCKKLKTVHFSQNSNLIKIGQYAFSNSSVNNIYIPKRCKQIDELCFASNPKLNHIEFDENSELKFISNKSFSSSNIKTIIIPSNVYLISSDAFYDCNNLNCISILGDFVCLQADSFKKCTNLSLTEFPNAYKIHIYKETFMNLKAIIYVKNHATINFR